MNTTRMTAVLHYCSTPRTMREISDATDGDLVRTKFAVYNLRKAGDLVNLNAGASTKVAGLFVVAAESRRFEAMTVAERVAGPVMTKRFDAGALVSAWRGAA